MSNLKVGDVVLVQQWGYGFLKEDIGKYVEVAGRKLQGGEHWYTVEPYECDLDSLKSSWKCSKSFGENPLILLNTVEAQKPSEVKYDAVNKPIHYQLTESLEVKDLMKILLDRIEQSDIGFSHFQSSCYKEAMQYLLRFMLKNGYEDLAKAQVYLTEVIENKRV